MVEPQDPHRYQTMMEKQTEATDAIAKMNQKLPEEFRQQAQKSLNELVDFRAELAVDLDELQAKASLIKSKLAQKIHFE